MPRDISGITDEVFKDLFSKKDILTDYVNLICNLNLDANKIEYANNESQEQVNLRGVRYDVYCEANDGMNYFSIDLEAQSKIPLLDYFDFRKIYYAAKAYSSGYQKGEDFKKKKVFVREIIFVKDNRKDNPGSPVRIISLYDKKNKKEYCQIMIYEIYINDLLAMPFENLDDYDKIVSEVVGVLVSKNVEQYLDSKNELTKKVAGVIMGYTEEYIKEMKERYEFDMKCMNDLLWEERVEEAHEQGKNEALKESVTKMRNFGLKDEEISKILELDLEFIKTL